MTSYVLDLSCINGYDMQKVFENPNDIVSKETLSALNIKHKKWRYNDVEYDIFRYDKGFMPRDAYSSAGVVRSVITKKGKVVCVSPPKSIDMSEFTTSTNVSNVQAEEFIDGVMINMFWDTDNNVWEFATRSTVGGEVSFFTTNGDSKRTFRSMILDATNKISKNWQDMLSHDTCYSFVLQHPEHRIVARVSEPSLTLVAAYKISDGVKATNIPLTSEFKSTFPEGIRFPLVYKMELDSKYPYTSLREQYASNNTDWSIVGVMFWDSSTGLRAKFRNPNYESLRHLRGNQPKLQYHYLTLRKEPRCISKYLKVWPEHRDTFAGYRDHLYQFTNSLYQHYVSTYIKKQNILGEVPHQYRNHVYNLHAIYLEELRPNKGYIDKRRVIQYVNKLPVAQLMYSLNYHLRKQVNAEENEKIIQNAI